MREMVVELNEFEAKLLYLLDLDCRKSSTQLAKKLKTSPQRIEYTINKFEKDGVIIRYSAVIDYSKLGSYTYYGYKIKFEIMDKKERLNLFEEIAQHKKCAFF
ncbi:MAG: Lrp/AsnC family transcriptional regulator, partial [Candidatus Anstonellaceae archaeon]